jgi:hypothetical protein
VSLVHATFVATDAATLAAAEITAASNVGATISSFLKRSTLTFRPDLRLSYLVLTYLLQGMLLLDCLNSVR